MSETHGTPEYPDTSSLRSPHAIVPLRSYHKVQNVDNTRVRKYIGHVRAVKRRGKTNILVTKLAELQKERETLNEPSGEDNI